VNHWNTPRRDSCCSALRFGSYRQGWHTPGRKPEKLLTIAKIAYEEFDSDLRAALKKPLPQAKKALKRFPSIPHGDGLATGEIGKRGQALVLAGLAGVPSDSRIAR
jgi:hypothetical protein